MSYCAHCGAEVSPEASFCASCGKPPRSHAGAAPAPARSSKAPILIGLAVLAFFALAVAGVIAAIFIPNFVDALHKAKQKRTVEDMREVGTGWMSWLSDEVSAAAAGATTHYDFGALDQALTAAELERQLRGRADGVPYVEEVPAVDGWGHSFQYRQASDFMAAQFMAIRSPGRDGEFETGIYESGLFDPAEYDQDIVWADGYFVRAPVGRVP